jgi:hypothetical protein
MDSQGRSYRPGLKGPKSGVSASGDACGGSIGTLERTPRFSPHGGGLGVGPGHHYTQKKGQTMNNNLQHEFIKSSSGYTSEPNAKNHPSVLTETVSVSTEPTQEADNGKKGLYS